MKSWLKLVLAGWFIHFGTNSLYQDLIGKEEYIMRVDAGWVPWYITVPIALTIILWALLIIDENKGDKRK